MSAIGGRLNPPHLADIQSERDFPICSFRCCPGGPLNLAVAPLKVIHFDQTFDGQMLNLPHHRLGPILGVGAESPVTLLPETGGANASIPIYS